MSGNSDATALVAAPSSEELYGRLQDSLHALGDGASALEETQRRLAEEQRRLTEHLRRNLGLASLRVTISTEQRKQLEGALRTWTEQMRRLAYRRLKAMWLAETSVAFHRWLLLRRGVVGWCALMNAVHRQRQRTAVRFRARRDYLFHV